jgi:hypothetical protein
MTSRPITATEPRVLGCCVACLLGQRHDEHDTSLPVVQRASITAPARRAPDPLIPGYLTEAVPYPPAI